MRHARSLREMGGFNQSISMDEFRQKAFFNVYPTDAGYLDQFGTWRKSPDKKALVRDDGSYVSTVGKHYSIVDNQNFFEGVVKALNDSGVAYVPKTVQVEGNGRRTTMIVKLPQFQMFSDTREEQDFELRVRNSFDTTLAADTIVGFLRLICTNGMTAFQSDFSFRMIHKGDVIKKAEDAIELYKNFDGVYRRNQDIFERMGLTHVDRTKVSAYIGDGEMTAQTIFKGDRWANKILQSWQETGETNNLWTLYNMFTALLSHDYGHNYNSKLNKMTELNKEVAKWPRLFHTPDFLEAA